jgi:hypothetical protein
MSLGRYDEAVHASAELVGLGRLLVQHGPKEQRLGLSASLINLCISLNELGRDGEAREPGEEALALVWPFFEHHPQRHASQTSMVLRRLVRVYAGIQQPVPQAIQGRMATFERLMRS